MDIFELGDLLGMFISGYEKRHELELSEEKKREIEDKLIAEMDRDQSGTIDVLELKVYLTRKYD